ncbi:adipokinetic hormone/corazonin-related peptide receptor variant I-like [Atheta coriaria]|uniref:adipokinetic hormone/corazonin-related peptide receptor variant I-like n=1 Tax=Dalotia coriaria TaxID=877792 RepID=UPI0031F382A1
MQVEYPRFDSRALVVVIVYCCVFVVACIGNVTVFVNLFRSRRRKSRISFLIIHLTVADLIVTFIMIPFEIAWRITVQWLGGNIACKILLFFRAFGLYLSSNVLICISLDRYFAVVHPLMMTNKRSRGKWMLYCAWLASTFYASPQILIFHVETHPHFANFTQCVSFDSFASPRHEFLYNILCLTMMYFLPLTIIIAAYASILYKMWHKARESSKEEVNNTQSTNSSEKRVSNINEPHHSKCNSKYSAPLVRHNNSSESKDSASRRSRSTLKVSNINATTPTPSHEKIQVRKHRDHVVLRRSDAKCIERARRRTLKMTAVIVIVFVVCWTPYVVMALWYMFDRQSAQKVPLWLQDGLFMMAVSNSCMNPLVYGRYTVRTVVGGNRWPNTTSKCCLFGCAARKRSVIIIEPRINNRRKKYVNRPLLSMVNFTSDDKNGKEVENSPEIKNQFISSRKSHIDAVGVEALGGGAGMHMDYKRSTLARPKSSWQHKLYGDQQPDQEYNYVCEYEWSRGNCIRKKTKELVIN